jgi:hypothetical protein
LYINLVGDGSQMKSFGLLASVFSRALLPDTRPREAGKEGFSGGFILGLHLVLANCVFPTKSVTIGARLNFGL